MAHLPSLQIGNFKVFKEYTDFDFAPITALTGKNSSGKSSLVKAIQLLSEHLKVDGEISFDTLIQVSKILPALGNFEKILSHHNPKLKTLHYRFPYLTIEGTENDRFSIEIVFKLADTETKSGKLEKMVIEKWYDAVEETYLETTQEIFSVKAVDEFTYDTHIDLDYFFEKYRKICEKLSEDVTIFPGDLFSGFTNESYQKIKHLLFLKNEDFYNDNNNNISELYKAFGYRTFINPKGSSLNQEQIQIIEKWLNDYELDHSTPITNFKQVRKIDVDEKFRITENFENSVLILDNKFDATFRLGNVIANNCFYINSTTPSDWIKEAVKKSNTDITKDLKDKLEGKELLVYRSYTFLNDDETIKNLDGLQLFRDDKGDDLFRTSLGSLDEEDFPSNDIGKNRMNFFLKNFVQENILKSLKSILMEPLINTDFISINRNELKRSYKTDDKFGKLLFEVLEKNIEYKNFINKYVKEFEIGESVFVETDKEGEFSRVYLKNKGKEMLLSDVGFGVSQLLPILLKIVLIAGTKKKEEGFTLFIEEPESNLHPALQSKLADMFIDATKEFNIHFVIETHSEYLIRRMQLLTANTYTTTNKKEEFTELKTSDTRIYYFYSPDEIPEGEPQVYPIDIEEDGALTKNFGKGFFDESSNLNYALYQYSKINKN